ncbi:hypothetical protein [Alkalihalobacillus pseudalcaliphilus]|uniref:hypothetical protein n=1 Tax=Alkalihalobacillus pseudalcaliphilus TaxID=79884 RepID=UPI00064DBDAA|nr:hypothetical protein [Alkalihalobacillus pseudalcaliphilus]KMK76161.1 hypothetical protein AB990_13135 [Alkalihalobacillus pseudalcaliphilus]
MSKVITQADVKVRSKKKRIRNKVAKRVIQNPHRVEVVMKQERIPESKPAFQEENNEELNQFDKMPITKLLKLGKNFIKEEEVIKYYYTAGKDPYYKNKPLLVKTIKKNMIQLTEEKQNELMKLVQ